MPASTDSDAHAGTGPAAAGFWQRCAAWTLDAVPLAVLAWLATLAWQGPGAARVMAALQALNRAIASTMLDVLAQGGGALQFAFALLRAPVVASAMDAVAAALLAWAWPPLVVFALCSLLYHAAFEASSWQGSPGKRLLGLTVVDTRLGAPGPWRAGARNAAGVLSWLTLNLGHAMAALPPHQRALHDYCAGTRVLARRGTSLSPWALGWLALVLAASLILPVLAACWWQDSLDAALQAVLG